MDAKCVLACLFLFTCDQLALGDYEVNVAVLAYRNSNHRTANGRCCDPWCFSQCDNYFVFCLAGEGGGCGPAVLHTGEVGEDRLTFTPASGSTIGHQPNPMTLSSTGVWPGYFHLLVDIYDKDDIFPATLNGDEFIDTVSVQLNLNLGSTYSLPTGYRGTYTEAIMTLSFQATCTDDYYGPDCGTYCHARDDLLGHYTCDGNGMIVCNHGYRYPINNCTECIPAPGCSALGGFCRLPDECVCKVGYTGSLCETAVNACGFMNPCKNGGTCTEDGNCTCPTGYTGPSCSTDSGPCAASPCHNRGQCVEVEGSQYVCDCPEGYDGDLCELEGRMELGNRDSDSSNGDDNSNGSDSSNGTDSSNGGDSSNGSDSSNGGDNNGGDGSEEEGEEDGGEAAGSGEQPSEDPNVIIPQAERVGDGAGGDRGAVVGGTVAAVLVVVLLAGMIAVLVALLCRRRWKLKRQGEHLRERLLEDTEPPGTPSTPGENPTYVPSAVGFHVRPAPSASMSSDATLMEVSNPLLEEAEGEREPWEPDLSVNLQNPLYTTAPQTNGDHVVPPTESLPIPNGDPPKVYSTYALLGDRHADVMYDTIDHKLRPVLQVAPNSPSSSVTSSAVGSTKYDYVRTPGAIRVQVEVHDTQESSNGYSTPYHDMDDPQLHKE